MGNVILSLLISSGLLRDTVVLLCYRTIVIETHNGSYSIFRKHTEAKGTVPLDMSVIAGSPPAM